MKKPSEQYFKDHADEFMTEETVTLEYLDLNKAALGHGAAVEEADLKAAYEKEAAAFKPSPERTGSSYFGGRKTRWFRKSQARYHHEKIESRRKFLQM
ncbi:MAG: hypothetical protein R3E67_01755 [Pseudomonadales bacterium]